MMARVDISAPLEIEVTEEEILADLLYPAPAPAPAGALRGTSGVERRDGHRHRRANGDANANLGRGIRRDRAAA